MITGLVSISPNKPSAPSAKELCPILPDVLCLQLYRTAPKSCPVNERIHPQLVSCPDEVRTHREGPRRALKKMFYVLLTEGGPYPGSLRSPKSGGSDIASCRLIHALEQPCHQGQEQHAHPHTSTFLPQSEHPAPHHLCSGKRLRSLRQCQPMDTHRLGLTDAPHGVPLHHSWLKTRLAPAQKQLHHPHGHMPWSPTSSVMAGQWARSYPHRIASLQTGPEPGPHCGERQVVRGADSHSREPPASLDLQSSLGSPSDHAVLPRIQEECPSISPSCVRQCMAAGSGAK